LLDSGQLFDVQVNELAWSGAAIAARWRRRIQQAKAMKRMGVQDARDSGLGQPTLPSDLKGRQP
jgi:hypothetical protein